VRILKSIQIVSVQLHLTCPPHAIQPFGLCACVCSYRADEACPPSPRAYLPGGGRGSEQRLQVKIQAFEKKMGEERGEEGEVEEDSPAPQRRYSLSQAGREERREMRFNRSVSTKREPGLLSFCSHLSGEQQFYERGGFL